MPLRVLIVDDERYARQRLRRLLGEVPDVEIVGESASGREAIAAIAEHAPDVVLLDVQMPNLDGFDVLRALEGRAPLVIFVTAFDQHALRAFQVHALDYLLKPVEPARFREAIDRARAQLAQSTAAERHQRLLEFLRRGDEDALAAGGPPSDAKPDTRPNARSDVAAGPAGAQPAAPFRESLDRLLVKDAGRMYFVPTADIDWIEAYGNYVRIHAGARTHLMRKTLGALEHLLDPRRFVRIHRSTIVNLDRVAQMELWGSGDYIVRLSSGARLKLSRWYRDRIEARVGR